LYAPLAAHKATRFGAVVPEIQNLDRSAAVWVFQLP
jgi:hypothetical protein